MMRKQDVAIGTSPGADFTFARLIESNRPAHAKLFEDVFGTVPDPDFIIQKSWGWETADTFLAFGVFSDGTLVGAITYYPRTFVRDGTAIKCVEAGDVVVSLDMRRQGLFSRLIEYSFRELAQDGIPIMYGFPNKLSRRGWQKAGVAFPYELQSAIHPLAPLTLLAERLPFPSFIATAVDNAYRYFRSVFARKSLFDITILDGVPGELCSLTQSPTMSDCYERQRPSEYFAWRYSWSEADRGSYRTILLSMHGKHVAFFVVKLEADNAITVFEMACPQSALLDQAIACLASHAAARLERHCGTRISKILFPVFSGTQPLVAALRKNGFVMRRTSNVLMMWATTSEFAPLLDHKLWYFSLADSDLS